MDVINASASGLFVTRGAQQAQLEGLAQRQLSAALEHFVGKRYDEAIATFKRAIALAPLSGTATNAYDYMAQAYLSKEDVPAAIAAYKESLRANPTDANAYAQLGNIYVTQGDLGQAKASYQEAVRLDGSSANRYALAQAHMELGEFRAAEEQFNAVRNQEPGKPNGDYGLGLVYARQGKTADAISAFERAISKDRTFYYAQAELGYVLADVGEHDKAQALADGLKGKADDLAKTLSDYIYEKTPAEMIGTLNTSAYMRQDSTVQAMLSRYDSVDFQKGAGPKTPVASLSSYLAEPGGQQMFAMTFVFSKAMDAQSVENVGNWTISRASDYARGSVYNFGMPVPASEARLEPHPAAVRYNAADQTATVLFRITQNAAGDATIDPSHIRFSFSGSDALGLKVGAKADEYTGISGFA